MKYKKIIIQDHLINDNEKFIVQYIKNNQLFSGLKFQIEDNNLVLYLNSINLNQFKKTLNNILNQYNISWIDAPKNFEAEHIAACLNQKNIVDAVLTNDSDTLLFGAKQIIKISKIKKKKIFLLYSLNNISTKYKIDLNDLIKVGLCLGTDFNKKGVKGIGIKKNKTNANGVRKKLSEFYLQIYYLKNVYIK